MVSVKISGRLGFQRKSALISGKNVLAPHKPRIQASRDGLVRSALDDGASVGKQRHLIRLTPEFEDKIIVFHLAMRLKTHRHFSEINRAVALMDLDRVSAAQGDLCPAFSGKIGELVFSASWTIRAWTSRSDFSPVIAPEIKR